MKRTVRADIIMIAALLAAFGIWFVVSNTTGAEPTGAVVVCQSSDGFYRADPLSADVSYTVEVSGSAPGTAAGENRVRISQGTVDVTSADCSNQICVDHDPIDAVGEQIVCLPHGVVIEVVAREQDAARLS